MIGIITNFSYLAVNYLIFYVYGKTEYLDKPSNVISHDIIEGYLAGNLFGKIQLLGILLHRHGIGFIVGKSQLTGKMNIFHFSFSLYMYYFQMTLRFCLYYNKIVY